MVGLYVIASRLIWALANVSIFVIFDLGLVVLSRLRGRPEHHREAAYYTLRITALLCLPLFVGAALMANPLILLLLGAHWIESVPLFQLLCLFSVLFAPYRCAQQILISAGRPETALRLAVVISVLVPAFTLAAASFGIVAATVAASLAMATALPVAVRCLQVELGLRVWRLLIEQIPLWLATGAMGLVIWLLPSMMGATMAHGVVLVALQMVCGSGVFVAAVLLLAPGFAQEVAGRLWHSLARPASRD
jgi:O-antigen/teichoic acid export membrane protein